MQSELCLSKVSNSSTSYECSLIGVVVGEFQAALINVQTQAATDAKAREDAALARINGMQHAACQTDANKAPKTPPTSLGATTSSPRHQSTVAPATSPTDAELGVLNRSGLEALVADKCAIIGELHLTRQTQSEQLDELKRQLQTSAENLVAFHRASENAQQLLRQEITVLRDTITNLQDSSSASIRERQASLTAYLTKMKTDHIKAMMLATSAAPGPDSRPKSSTVDSRETVATNNQEMEADITKLIPWSGSDVQTESLAHATAEAAVRAEAELDNLPLGFVQEDEATEVEALRRLSLTTDALPHELMDTIQAMAEELETAKASSRKLHTVQLHRIVTLSSHLSKVSAEMLLLRKKERATMESLLTADQETLWSQDGPEARAFLAMMREACGTSPVDPMVAKFLMLGEAVHSLVEGCEHEVLQVTTQDTPPASAMPQATDAPDSHDGMNNQQLNDHDDGRLDLLQAANPTKQNHKELQYLKSLAGNRSDTLRSLALAQWELLVLKMQLVTLHARNVEMKERRVRFHRPHVGMTSMTEILHQGIHRRECALSECHQRHDRLRERLKHVNLCNRVTKFRYDKDSHEYSFMHVTKFVYPKSAGPTKSSPFQLKPSVQVSGIRAPQHDGALNDALQDE
ncbi:hypothetical protein DYB37_001247 [Aphanomyces astaci]|uniref:Uncharacterized protein n=1 Tax=Aphanomyces astaci TaxID=112090 RepID=A0A3R7BBP3_APHAT|nr:hypothetical protein DYB37_001247 [Aphanomyces astaci]